MTKPLKGISLLGDYGSNGRSFIVNCSCCDKQHELHIHINNPKEDFVIEIYSDAISSVNVTKLQRIKYTMDMLLKRTYYVETDTLLDKEMAYNVATALEDSYRSIVGDFIPHVDLDFPLVLNLCAYGSKITLTLDTEVEDYIGIFSAVASSNDPYVTWKKRISMAWSMLTKGYYEVGIDLQLKPNDAIMFIQALSTLTTKLKP